MLITETLRNIQNILPKSQRDKGYFVLLLIFLNSILEVLGLSLLVPIVGVILRKDFFEIPSVDSVYTYLEISSEKEFLLLLCLTIVISIILKNIFSFYIQKYQARYSYQVYEFLAAKSMTDRYTNYIKSLSVKNSNQLIWEINIIPNNFVNFLLLPLITFFNELLIVITVLGVIIYYDYRILVILGGIILPLIIIYFSMVREKLEASQRRMGQLDPELKSLSQQVIFGFMDVKTSNKYDFFQKKYKMLLSNMSWLSVKHYSYTLIPSKLIEIGVILGAVCIVLFTKIFVKDDAYLISLFGIFSIAAYKLVPSIHRISSALINVKSYQYVFEYMYLLSKTEIGKKSEIKLDSFNNIELKNFSFSYPNTGIILSDINIKINKGEQVGIIGKSGSGKSTLMNCLLGFYHDYSGGMTINNVELTEDNQDSWLSMVGYVPQNVFLLDGSIKQNITFGIPESEINKERLQRVIEKSSLTTFINQLPKGLDTPTGELGSKLSGGQKQRIGIARALYYNAEVLFLDEATSALDNDIEGEIIETLYKLGRSENITTIIVAHKYSTLKRCDHIYKLDAGTIIDKLDYHQVLEL